MSTYSTSEVLDRLVNASADMNTLYSQSFINYRGLTSDTKELYTEVISGYLLNHLALFNQIKMITRQSTYKVPSHDGKLKNQSSNRKEERIAIEMYNQKHFELLGEIIDYQVPLKNKFSDKRVGKIDLLAYDGEEIKILELKKPDSSETMLRSVLEGYTYSNIIDKQKMLNDYKLPVNTKIKAFPLVFFDSLQHQEMKNLCPNLKQLMKRLDTKPYYITITNDGYKITD